MLSFIDEIKWRGLFHQATNEEALRAHLADPAGRPRRAYVGFDPTADSLTIGNLVPMMLLVNLQRSGHVPVVVMGGGTGLIGDPSGKSAERMLNSEERVLANVEAQRPIFERLWGGAGLQPPRILNNLDWLGKLGYIEALRDIGKHFSVNMMIQKDSVRERLHARDQGISYTEFSYMILQAYDYLHLFRNEGVTVQMGGSDQWGNIVAGVDLIARTIAPDFLEFEANQSGYETPEATWDRLAKLAKQALPSGDLDDVLVHNLKKLARAEVDRKVQSIGALVWESVLNHVGSLAFGLTVPLVTKADGGKFGKTESGAVWLTADRTSPYAYYQFWLNAADADVGRFLRLFTLLPREEIGALEAAHAKDPGAREPHRALARHATALLHGDTEMQMAERAARALFSGEIAGLPEATLAEALASAPATDHDRSLLLGDGAALVDLLPLTTLAKSKREAKEFLASGSVTVNGRKAGPEDRLTPSDLLHGRLIALRRGKKSWHLTRWA